MHPEPVPTLPTRTGLALALQVVLPVELILCHGYRWTSISYIAQRPWYYGWLAFLVCLGWPLVWGVGYWVLRPRPWRRITWASAGLLLMVTFVFLVIPLAPPIARLFENYNERGGFYRCIDFDCRPVAYREDPQINAIVALGLLPALVMWLDTFHLWTLALQQRTEQRQADDRVVADILSRRPRGPGSA